MTFATGMVLAAAVLPYLFTATAKFGGPGYDNADPTSWAATLTGWRARAHAAHRNAFEAFAPFAAAVLAAQWAHAPQGRVNWLAGAFVGVRVLHGLAYVAGAASVRSVLFGLGFGCVVLLFLSA